MCLVQHVSIASLLVLLLGTLLSTIAQVGEVMAAGINYINPDYTGVMVQGSGRLIMLISLIIIAPLSLLRELREVNLLLLAINVRLCSGPYWGLSKLLKAIKLILG